jgi:hypothetical protein
MVYLKILSATNGELIGAEQIENPVYVYQQKNGYIVQTESTVKAQGILSADVSLIYQLSDKNTLTAVEPFDIAVIVPVAEFENCLLELKGSEGVDEEDNNPVVPDDTDSSTVLTRAELTAKVTALEEELAGAKILLGVE